MDDTDYAFGRTHAEYGRLIEQAELFRPLTEGKLTMLLRHRVPSLRILRPDRQNSTFGTTICIILYHQSPNACKGRESQIALNYSEE
jgi:hypothetical protein